MQEARKASADSTMTVFLSFAFFAAILTHIGCSNQRRSPENGGRRYNRIQHGQCAYTFILPEHDGNCRESATEQYNTNALQRDAPHVEPDFSSQKLQHLEHVMENYTQWLQKVSDRFRFLIALCLSLPSLQGAQSSIGGLCLPCAPGGSVCKRKRALFSGLHFLGKPRVLGLWEPLILWLPKCASNTSKFYVNSVFFLFP